MTDLCHEWPSISPWNVWDLPWFVWVGFAQTVDAIRSERSKRG